MMMCPGYGVEMLVHQFLTARTGLVKIDGVHGKAGSDKVLRLAVAGDEGVKVQREETHSAQVVFVVAIVRFFPSFGGLFTVRLDCFVVSVIVWISWVRHQAAKFQSPLLRHESRQISCHAALAQLCGQGFHPDARRISRILPSSHSLIVETERVPTLDHYRCRSVAGRCRTM